jgi:hypothetical protein
MDILKYAFRVRIVGLAAESVLQGNPGEEIAYLIKSQIT